MRCMINSRLGDQFLNERAIHLCTRLDKKNLPLADTPMAAALRGFRRLPTRLLVFFQESDAGAAARDFMSSRELDDSCANDNEIGIQFVRY